MTRQIQVESAINLPPLSIKGLLLANNVTDPDHIVEISSGACRDINNNIDILVGLSNAEGFVNSAPLLVNALRNGANGLDDGTLTADKLYAVYVIADSRGYESTAGLISLTQDNLPKMPFGYDSNRLVGYMATDSSSNFRIVYYSGDGNTRTVDYDAEVSVLSAAANTTFAPIDISALIPNKNNAVVKGRMVSTFVAPGDFVAARKFGSTGGQYIEISTIAGNQSDYFSIPVGLDSGSASIETHISVAGSYTVTVCCFSISV